jgi:glutathionyl-hydroquinone reductase
MRLNQFFYWFCTAGVYKCGFAQSQAAYDEAITELYSSLDRVEAILAQQRYLVGSALTEADIRLFMTLVRFDEVYVVYFKCNVRRIVDYPNIRQYCRDIYQVPGMAQSVNMYHIKTHYFTSHPVLNAYAVVPKGPDVIAELSQPHDRHLLSA